MMKKQQIIKSISAAPEPAVCAATEALLTFARFPSILLFPFQNKSSKKLEVIAQTFLQNE